MSFDDQTYNQNPNSGETADAYAQAGSGELQPAPATAETPVAAVVEVAKKKTKDEILAEFEAQARKVREKRSKFLSQQASQERKLATRQAVIIGAWLRANPSEALTWSQVAARLARPQDREAFGLEPIPETPAELAAGSRISGRR